MEARYNVLFLCTGNSARSIMAEAILNYWGKPVFRAFSAGSHPSGFVRPEALHQLEIANLPTEGLRSKDWSEFTEKGAPENALRHHGLRQRSKRGLSCLARAPIDGPLGPSRPHRCSWNTRRGFHNSRPPNPSVLFQLGALMPSLLRRN